MSWLREQFELYPRRLLVVVLAVCACLFLLLTQPAQVALADACGTQPNWYDLSYVSWLACETTTVSPQAVFSPVLNTIDSDVNTMSGSITSALTPLNDMASSITNGVTGFLTPSATDGADLGAQLNQVAQKNTSLAYAVTLSNEVQAIQASVDNLSSSASSGGTPTDTTNTATYQDVYGNTYTIKLGLLSTGVSWFLGGLDQLGWSPTVFRQFFDAWWAVVVLVAILRDFGVHVGTGIRAIDEHRELLGSKNGDD